MLDLHTHKTIGFQDPVFIDDGWNKKKTEYDTSNAVEVISVSRFMFFLSLSLTHFPGSLFQQYTHILVVLLDLLALVIQTSIPLHSLCLMNMMCVCVCVCIAHAIFTSEAIPTSRKLNGRNRYLIIVVVIIIIIMEQLVRARDTADNLVVGWLVVACRESS